MDVKSANKARAMFSEVLESADFPGYTYVGVTDEGALFQNVEGDYIVVRTIVKADTFDGVEAMEVHAEKAVKAKEKAAKSAEKAAKDIAKRDKEKAKIAELEAKKAKEKAE